MGPRPIMKNLVKTGDKKKSDYSRSAASAWKDGKGWAPLSLSLQTIELMDQYACLPSLLKRYPEAKLDKRGPLALL